MAPSWAVTAVLAALLTAATIAAPLSINAGSTTGTVTLPAGTYDYVTVTNVHARVVVGTNVVSNGAFTIQGASTIGDMGASQISLINCRASVMTIGSITGTAASLQLQGVSVTGITRFHGVTDTADAVSVKQSTLGPITFGSMRSVRNGVVLAGNTITCTASTSCVYLQGDLMGTATTAGFDITGNTITASHPSTSTTYYGLNFGASQAAKLIINNNTVTMTHGLARCLNFAQLTSLSSAAPLQLAITHNELRATSTTGTTSVVGVHIAGELSDIDSLVFENIDFAVSGNHRGVGIHITAPLAFVRTVSIKNCRFDVTATSSASVSDVAAGLLLPNAVSNVDTLEIVNNTVTGSHIPSGGGLLIGSTADTPLRFITRLAITGNTVKMASTFSSLAGIRLMGLLENISLSDNTITLTQPTGSGTVTGIDTSVMMNHTPGVLELLRNTISVVARGQAFGINFATTVAAGVIGAVVENVVNVQATTSVGVGLQVGFQGPSSGSDGALLVQRNNVTVTMATGSATGLGIQRADHLSNFTIEENVVHAAGMSTLNGLYMARWHHCRTGFVRWNRITTRHTNHQNRDGSAYGLHVESSSESMQNVELVGNTIDVEGASTYTVAGIHFGSSIRYGGNWTWRGNNVTVANRYRYTVTSYYSGSAHGVYINGYLQHMDLLQLQGNTFTTLAGDAAYGVYLRYTSTSSSFRSNVTVLAITDNTFYQGTVAAITFPGAATYGVNANMLMRDVGAFIVSGNLFTNVLPGDSPFGTNPAEMRSLTATGFAISRSVYNVSFDMSNNTVELYARSTATGITAAFHSTSQLRVRQNALRLHAAQSTRSSVYGLRMIAHGDVTHAGALLVDRNGLELECSASATAISVLGSYFGSVNITDNVAVGARSPRASTSAKTGFYGVTVAGATSCKHLRVEGNRMDGTGAVCGRGVYVGPYSHTDLVVRSNTFLISSPALAAQYAASGAMQMSTVSRSDTVITNNTFIVYGGIATGLSVVWGMSYGSFHAHKNDIQVFTMFPSQPRSYGMTFSYITSMDAFVVSNNIVALRAQLASGEDMPLASQPYTAIGLYFDNDVDGNKAVGVVSNTIDVLCGRYAVSGIELGDTVDHVYNTTLHHMLYNVTEDGTLSFSNNEINIRTPTTSATFGVRFTSSIRDIAQGLLVSGNRMTCGNPTAGEFHGVSVNGSALSAVALLEVAENTIQSHVATLYGVSVRSSMASVVAKVQNNRLTQSHRGADSTVHGVYFAGQHASCTVEVEGNTIDLAAAESDRCVGRGVAFTGSTVLMSRYRIAGNNITHASPAASFFHGIYLGGDSTDTDNVYNITGNALSITAQRAAAGVLTQRRFGLRTTVEISSNSMAVSTVEDNAVGIRIEGELEDTLLIAQNKIASTARLTSAAGIVVAALGRNSTTPRSTPTARGFTSQWIPDDDGDHNTSLTLLAASSIWIVASNDVTSTGAGSAAFTVSTLLLEKVNIVAEGNRFTTDGPRDPQPSTTARVWTAPVQLNSTRLTTAVVWFQKNVIAAANKTAADCVLQLPEAMGAVTATLRANTFLERDTPLLLARSIAAPLSLPLDFAFVCNYFGTQPLVNRTLVEPHLPMGATLVMRRCTVSPSIAHSATVSRTMPINTPSRTRPSPPSRTSTVPEHDSSSVQSSSAAAASSLTSEQSTIVPPPHVISSFSSAAHSLSSTAPTSSSVASEARGSGGSGSSAPPVSPLPSTAEESSRSSPPTAVSSSSAPLPSSLPTTAPEVSEASSHSTLATPASVTASSTAESSGRAASSPAAPATAGPTAHSASGLTRTPTAVPATAIPAGASSSPVPSAPATDSSAYTPTTSAPLTPAPTAALGSSAASAAAASSVSSAVSTTPAPPAPPNAPTLLSSSSAAPTAAPPASPAPASPAPSAAGSAAPTPQPSPAPTPESSPAPGHETPAPERTLTIQMTPPPVLPAGVTESAEAIGTTLAGAGALLASPATAARLARAVAVLELAELCGSDQLPHVSKLPFSSSPLGLGIGPDIGQYYRGAVIGNMALGLVLGVIVTVAVFITSKLPCATNALRHPSGRPHSPWLRACGFWRYPSCLVVGLAFLLDGTVHGALAGALHGDPSAKGLDLALCAVVMLGLAALFAGLGYFHVRGPTTHVVHFVPEERDRSASLPRRTALFFGGAHGHWLVRPASLSPDDSSRQRMWALLFTWYRAPMHRFLLLDLGATALIAVLRSVPPDRCATIVWAVTAINVAVLAAAAAMRPYNVPLKTMLLVATSVVTVVASVLVVVALRDDPATEGLITAAAVLAVIAMYLIVLNVIVSVARHVYKQIRACRAPRRVNTPFANELGTELRAHSDLAGVRDVPRTLADGREDLVADFSHEGESRDSDSTAPRGEFFSPMPLHLSLGGAGNTPAGMFGGGRMMDSSALRRSLVGRTALPHAPELPVQEGRMYAARHSHRDGLSGRGSGPRRLAPLPSPSDGDDDVVVMSLEDDDAVLGPNRNPTMVPHGSTRHRGRSPPTRGTLPVPPSCGSDDFGFDDL